MFVIMTTMVDPWVYDKLLNISGVLRRCITYAVLGGKMMNKLTPMVEIVATMASVTASTVAAKWQDIHFCVLMAQYSTRR